MLSLILRWAGRGLFALLAVFSAAWLLDLAVYQVRRAMHAEVGGSVRVYHYLAVPLKSGRYEIDPELTEDVPCVRAMFPQGGSEPCWYLRRHADDRRML
jgi:hypothetical protein